MELQDRCSIDSGPISGQMMNDTVILFHGIARTKKSMEKFAVFLSGNGYRVVNVGFLTPSTRPCRTKHCGFCKMGGS
ncbi:hypothetical protein JOH51_004900 [Rhizobium leguminosarum]|nr:hypothetical protein [Rhizobium leguminosarum]